MVSGATPQKIIFQLRQFWAERKVEPMAIKHSDGSDQRRFLKNPPAKYLEAVKVLRELLSESDLDTVRRAYAQATWASYRDQFAELSEIHFGSGSVCAHKLLGRNHCRENFSDCEFPARDHASYGVAGRKTMMLISQPYSLAEDDLRNIVQFCDKNKVKVSVTANDSWHFPGDTLLIVYRKKD